MDFYLTFSTTQDNFYILEAPSYVSPQHNIIGKLHRINGSFITFKIVSGFLLGTQYNPLL